MSKFQIGDIVKGNEKSKRYAIANQSMAEGKVIAVNNTKIECKVLKHSDPHAIGKKYYGLDEECYDFVRHEESLTKKRLQSILNLHKKWLADKKDGERANLSNADLRYANLRCADLSGAKGLLSAIEYLDAHFERTEKGYVAYKTFNAYYHPPKLWQIEPDSIITENVNPNRTDSCGSGINVAPLDWVCKRNGGEIWKVLIEWPWLAGVIVPYNTDGKIRCERVRLLEVVK